MPVKNLLRVMLITSAILLVPLIAMQFTNEVNWTLSDFVIMGTLLSVTGILVDLAWRTLGKYRALAIVGVLGLFLWLWAELAVGVFTNWGS